MNTERITTARLELVGCTPELLRAEGDDRARFAALLEAAVPESWPPELYDEDARQWTLRAVEETPDAAGWWMYYVVGDEPGGRELVGVVGYKGPPTEDGTVEVGYGILPEYRRRGYAVEATRALIGRAFGFPQVTRVVAETYPHLVPSLGVMGRCGLTFAGDGSEEGVVRYELPRERWSPAR
ncbi:MAG TPA: GNAT family N-acetyltransferase [Longimicrobiaceae bacterium]|nr:GNAT family N-acetyltransferase [Longimicrobiaceae bacterium]